MIGGAQSLYATFQQSVLIPELTSILNNEVFDLGIRFSCLALVWASRCHACPTSVILLDLLTTKALPSSNGH